MKVAIFCETYLPYLNGVVTHVKLLKDGLEQKGHQVLIVTADPNARHHYLQNNVLHCPAISMKRFYGYGIANPISRRRMKMIEDFNPDICHIHQEFGVGYFGVMAAKHLKVPLVYTLHTMYEEYLYYVAPRPLVPVVKRVLHSYSRLLGNRAFELTGPSKKIENYFKSVGVDKPVNVIPNPVELDAFDINNVKEGDIQQVLEKYGISPDKTIAIFVGRLGREKSVDILLEYWKQAILPEDNLHLIVVGDGPVREELIQQAQDLGIQQMVTFTGKVLHDELLPYYAACKLYITASLSDTYSISMLEGMATGLPVLQRYDEINVDQVVNGVNGYVFRDAGEMGESLKRIRDMSEPEMSNLQFRVKEMVKSSGIESLANYITDVYNLALTHPVPEKKDKWFSLTVQKKKKD